MASQSKKDDIDTLLNQINQIGLQINRHEINLETIDAPDLDFTDMVKGTKGKNFKNSHRKLVPKEPNPQYNENDSPKDYKSTKKVVDPLDESLQPSQPESSYPNDHINDILKLRALVMAMDKEDNTLANINEEINNIMKHSDILLEQTGIYEEENTFPVTYQSAAMTLLQTMPPTKSKSNENLHLPQIETSNTSKLNYNFDEYDERSSIQQTSQELLQSSIERKQSEKFLNKITKAINQDSKKSKGILKSSIDYNSNPIISATKSKSSLRSSLDKISSLSQMILQATIPSHQNNNIGNIDNESSYVNYLNQGNQEEEDIVNQSFDGHLLQENQILKDIKLTRSSIDNLSKLIDDAGIVDANQAINYSPSIHPQDSSPISTISNTIYNSAPNASNYQYRFEDLHNSNPSYQQSTSRQMPVQPSNPPPQNSYLTPRQNKVSFNMPINSPTSIVPSNMSSYPYNPNPSPYVRNDNPYDEDILTPYPNLSSQEYMKNNIYQYPVNTHLSPQQLIPTQLQNPMVYYDPTTNVQNIQSSPQYSTLQQPHQLNLPNGIAQYRTQPVQQPQPYYRNKTNKESPKLQEIISEYTGNLKKVHDYDPNSHELDKLFKKFVINELNNQNQKHQTTDSPKEKKKYHRDYESDEGEIEDDIHEEKKTYEDYEDDFDNYSVYSKESKVSKIKPKIKRKNPSKASLLKPTRSSKGNLLKSSDPYHIGKKLRVRRSTNKFDVKPEDLRESHLAQYEAVRRLKEQEKEQEREELRYANEQALIDRELNQKKERKPRHYSQTKVKKIKKITY